MEINELRPEVIHITGPERALNYKWENKSQQLPAALAIMSVDDINNLPTETRDNLFGGHVVHENDVMILEPNSGQYIASTEAEQTFYDRKFNALSYICSLLGASRISMKIESFEENTRELNVDGDISYKAVQSSSSYDHKTIERYKSRYEKTREYSSPGISVDGYNKVVEYCKATRLILDDNIKALVEQRSPLHPNPMKKETYHIELSKELNDSLDIAFHLNVLKGVFALNSNVQRSIASCKKLVIETEIEF